MAGLNFSQLFATLTYPAAQQAVAAAFGVASAQVGGPAPHRRTHYQAVQIEEGPCLIAQATGARNAAKRPDHNHPSAGGPDRDLGEGRSAGFRKRGGAAREIDSLNTAASASSSLAGQLAAAASHLSATAATGV